MQFRWPMFGIGLSTILLGCNPGAGADTPVVPDLQPDRDYGVLPALLTDKGFGGMEAISAGTLTRRGSCLYLNQGMEPALIVWGDETEIVAEQGGWAVRFSSGQVAREGDYIRGAGGGLPPGAPITELVNENVPDDCAVSDAVQVYGVEDVTPAERPVSQPGFPPPPPPPPPPPTFLESVAMKGGDGQGPATEIFGVSNPEEALFLHMLVANEGIGPDRPKPVCLMHVGAEMLGRLRRQYASVHDAGACRWDNGLVVRRSDGTPAVLMEVKMQCDGRSRCVAEGSRVSANMGGEGRGYILRPVSQGWSIRATGMEWMS